MPDSQNAGSAAGVLDVVGAVPEGNRLTGRLPTSAAPACAISSQAASSALHFLFMISPTRLSSSRRIPAPL
ncbi:MAG: hypothetical protein EPN60_11845 [Nevskiaceae bacterium]|nr:MAG: hypothetical protein EPO48_01425 [Nevskiaceae bacterium]TAM25675.1 MAG: hypothetical protein EPN60_11845 [Nevskiaceae bacterium]